MIGYIILGVVVLFLLLEIAVAVYFFNYAIKPHPYDPYKEAKEHPEKDKT